MISSQIIDIYFRNPQQLTLELASMLYIGTYRYLHISLVYPFYLLRLISVVEDFVCIRIVIHVFDIQVSQIR